MYLDVDEWEAIFICIERLIKGLPPYCEDIRIFNGIQIRMRRGELFQDDLKYLWAAIKTVLRLIGDDDELYEFIDELSLKLENYRE